MTDPFNLLAAMDQNGPTRYASTPLTAGEPLT